MELIYAAAFVSFVLGASSYIIIRFWVLPIYRYQKRKRAVAATLSLYRKAREEDGSDDLARQGSFGNSPKTGHRTVRFIRFGSSPLVQDAAEQPWGIACRCRTPSHENGQYQKTPTIWKSRWAG